MYPKNMISIIREFYLNNDYSIREIANIFNISKSTIHRYIHSLTNHNNHKSLTTKIIKHPNISTHIKNIVSVDPLITAKQIKYLLFQQFNISISISGVYCHLKFLGFTKKKVSKKICRNKTLLALQQKQFKKDIKYINHNDIICIDETYFSSNIHHTYGWSLKGNRITCYSNRTSIKKICLLMAISNNKILAFKLYDTNINSVIYHDFLKSHLLPLIKNKYILMDNVAFHKTQIIKSLIESSTNKLLFIPPYSPQFNPIENVFSIIKNNFKNYYTSSETVKEKINKSINTLNTLNTNFNNIYKHAFNSDHNEISVFGI